MKIASMVRKLIGHWDRASAQTRASGLQWYPEARAKVADMATRHSTAALQAVAWVQARGRAA